MRIALLHYRAGLMDGVSLEMEKWKKVLKDMGHQVFVVAGNDSPGTDLIIEKMNLEDEDQKRLYESCFVKGDIYPNEINRMTEKFFTIFEEKLSDFDLIIPNNVWSLGLSLPLGLALEEFARKSSKHFIAHHHDFWWERDLKNAPSEYVRQILEEHFPPDLERTIHITINSIARDELKRRRGIDSVIVPNVFDFSKPLTDPETDSRIRRELSLEDGDLVFLQATRIVPRKAVEISVELVHEFERSSVKYRGTSLYNGEPFTGRVVLVFSGMCEDDAYMERILDLARRRGVEIIDASDHEFFDVYSIADVITYPSILEGWGNQLLEAICAKKPIVLFEYEVFTKDIKSCGLKYVSLGNEYVRKDGLVKLPKGVLKRAVDELLGIVFDRETYNDLVDHNFEIGKKYFSLDRLRNILEYEIFSKLEN